MLGIHDKIKYGDIVYVEYSPASNVRMVLTSAGFILKHKSYVDTKDIKLTGNSIYLKDFEDNLFVIFPTMNDVFLEHKAFGDETIQLIKNRIDYKDSLNSDSSTKKYINKIIYTYQEAKKEVYSENEKFIQLIGTPIKFGDTFILIHFKSQMFVTRHDSDLDSHSKQLKSKLILTDYYTHECIFLFSLYNNYDDKADYVFSNQNLYIRKKEKNIWANNQYLGITELKNYQKHIGIFSEDRFNATPFQIKVCANYIDPSSANLSFANPIWFCCQNADKYLIITPNKAEDIIVEGNNNVDDNINNNNNNPDVHRQNTMNYQGTRSPTLANYTISFESIDREKTMNNIYGGFNIEQVENQKNLQCSDQYLKEQVLQNGELRMCTEIEYNKKIRFRHVATKKYLGFEEIIKKDQDGNIVSNSKSLIFEDIPNDKCDWIFMESYKIIDIKKYQQSKEEGIKASGLNFPVRTGDEQKHTVKKKEIGRVFHGKTQKFLSFDELSKKNFSEYEDKIIEVSNLSVNKNPSDSDLVRLLPSNENQSWEIHGVLYFNSVLRLQITNGINTDIGKYMGTSKNQIVSSNAITNQKGNNGDIIPEDTVNTNMEKNSSSKDLSMKKGRATKAITKANIMNELNELHKNSSEGRLCFENLRDFCLNKFSRRFDTTASPGKPVYYRQEFLYDQGFLDKTFKFLKYATNFSTIYQQYLKGNDQNIQTTPGPGVKISEEGEMTTPGVTPGSAFKPANDKERGSIKTTNSLKRSGKTAHFREKIARSTHMGEILKEINLCITRSFEFISAMCKNHSKIKEKVFNNKDYFWDYLFNYKEASECLIDIIKDNETYMNDLTKESIDQKQSRDQIISNDEEDEEEDEEENNIIQVIITYLNSTDKYDMQVLNLLSRGMKSKNTGITSNQEYIFNCGFVKKQDRFLFKISPQYNDTVFSVVYRNESKASISRNGIELCTIKASGSEYDKNIVKYLAKELNGFADLCYGRNYVCIEVIRRGFPLDHLIYHIANVEGNEDIVSGGINILNYVYIDIEPHSVIIYPSLIKIVNEDLKIERINNMQIQTYIPLDKGNLILCGSLFLINNIKYGKIAVNNANINLIFNIIQFRGYENVIYKQESIKEALNNELDRSIHNLKEEVKNFVIKGERMVKAKSLDSEQSKAKLLKINKNEKIDDMEKEENTLSFFDKIGYKFVEFNFTHDIGSEYLIFVLDHFNDFFLERVIIDNIDANMENKTIISQTFKTVNKTDMGTSNNINYLMKMGIDIKDILTAGPGKGVYMGGDRKSNKKHAAYLPIMKQIAKVIDFIGNIKTEDMINAILENLLKVNKNVVKNVINDYGFSFNTRKIQDYIKNGVIDAYQLCDEEFSRKVNFKETMMENEYYLYQLFNKLNQHSNVCSNERDNGNGMINTNEISEQSYLLQNGQNCHPVNNEQHGVNLGHIPYKYDEMNKNYINYENEYLNAITFKTLQELIIRMLEINVDEQATKIGVRLFTRIHSQRAEIISCFKNIRMGYRNVHGDQYQKCRYLIKKLSGLAEKTEIWMSGDKIPYDKLGGKDSIIYEEKSRSRTGTNGIDALTKKKNEEDFKKVLDYLKLGIGMCYRENTKNSFIQYEKLRLMQTIFFSLQGDNVLFTLIREICQVFPVKMMEMDPDVKQVKFKHSLCILFSLIFKVFKCMIYNSSDFQNKIKDRLLFCKEYPYLMDGGFLNGISEITGKNESFANENMKYIKEIIVKEFTIKRFENVFKYFSSKKLKDVSIHEKSKRHAEAADDNNNQGEGNNDDVIITSNNDRRSKNADDDEIGNHDKEDEFNTVNEAEFKKNYCKEIKKCCQILILVKAVLSKVKDAKYINIIIKNYEKIMKQFSFLTDISQSTEEKEKGDRKGRNSVELTDCPTMKIIQITSKISKYKLKLLYYGTKISYRLIRYNDKLKGLISKVYPLHKIQDYILKANLPLSNNFEAYLMNNKNEHERIKKENTVVSQGKTFYKTKYNGFILFYAVAANELTKLKEGKENVILFFNILKQDLDKFGDVLRIFTELLEDKESEHEAYSNILIKKTAFQYFFKGIFPVIHGLCSLFKRDIFKNKDDYKKQINFNREVITRWKKLFLLMGKDKENKDYYLKTFTFVLIKKMDFCDFFSSFDFPLLTSSAYKEPEVNLYYTFLARTSSIAKSNEKYRQDVKQLTINFTETFINTIENNKKIAKYVDKEIEILAQNIKSKINFHQVMQMYMNKTNKNICDEGGGEQENNFHGLNIFLKFMQENYLSSKHYPQISFLIEGFGNLIEVKPKLLKSHGSNSVLLEDNYYFSTKIAEGREVFGVHCQKGFGYNGSVEVFLKLVCEGNRKFNNEVFRSVLKFFNNVLEGGNTSSQEKFYQLFVFFPNSDNFFFFIKQMFDNDIFGNGQNDVSLKEPKIDNDNGELIENLLKFLQLLTENHFTDLQNYLRDQASNRISYNFITIIVDYMSMLIGKLSNIFESSQHLTRYTIALYYKRLLSVLDTLSEFLQGPCEGNQQTLINSKIIELFDKILRETEVPDPAKEGSRQEKVEKQKTEKMKNMNNNENQMELINEEINDFDEMNSNAELDGDNDLQKAQNSNSPNTDDHKHNKIFFLLSTYEKSLLVYKIGLLLLAIIEGRKKKDDVLQKIGRDFDYKGVFDKIVEIYINLKIKMQFFLYSAEPEDYDKTSQQKVVAEAGFNLYFFLVSLFNIEKEETEFKKGFSLLNKESHRLSKIEKENGNEILPNFSLIQNAMQFYKQNSGNIEIVQGTQVLRVYCPKLNFFKNFTEDMFKTFQEEADRTSVQTKVNTLLAQKTEIYQTLIQLNNGEEFFKKTGPFQYLFTFPKVVQMICLTLGIIMNILILLGYNVYEDEPGEDNSGSNVELFGGEKSTSATILRVIGVILSCFSALIFTEFGSRRAPIIYRKIYVNYLKDLFEEKAKRMSEVEIRRIDKILTIDGFKDFIKKMQIYIRGILNPNVLYAMCYLGFALLGLFIHNFFFSFHGIEFVKSQPILRNVLKSVTEPIKQLIFIFIFFIIGIYFYSLGIFYSFYEIMPVNSCSSVIRCVSAIYSNVFTSGGNLGNFIDENEEHMNTEGNMPRYILDISFTIIMVWLVFQMVSGLIVDTFQSGRKDGEEIENDIQNTCFICGGEREKIEKYYVGKEGFNKHLEDHNIASYLFYMFYLEQKDPNEYSGGESYIKAQIDKELITWLPIERCIKIEEWELKHEKH